MTRDDVATCRGCGRELRGKPDYKGGPAFVPETGERAKANFYGGFVCSRSCDFRSSLEHEKTMPGHGVTQRTLGCFAAEHHKSNWGA
jgi:hypothetical protein